MRSFVGLALVGTSLFATDVVYAQMPEGLIVVAHRGVVTDTITENSLDALKECIRRGYTHVEVDLRVTKDGHAVCLHDSSLKRTTGVDKRIHQITLRELRELASVNTVPSFEAFCEAAAGRIDLMPDVKACPRDLASAFGKDIGDTLRAHDLMTNALFIGRKELVDRSATEGRVSTSISIEDARAQAKVDPEFARTHFVFGHAVDFTAEFVQAYQALGLPVVVSINLFHYPKGDALQQGLDDIARMRSFGVAGVQIDSDYDSILRDE